MDEDLLEEEEFVTSFCPDCGAENGPIGSLGKRKHYTCRYCGSWWSDYNE